MYHTSPSRRNPRKRKRGLLCLLLSALLLAGCADAESRETQKLEVATSFLTEYFTFNKQQRYDTLSAEQAQAYEAYYRPFAALATSSCVDTLQRNREPLKYDKLCAAQGLTPEIDALQCEAADETTYTFEISYTDEAVNAALHAPIQGKLTLEITEDQILVDRIELSAGPAPEQQTVPPPEPPPAPEAPEQEPPPPSEAIDFQAEVDRLTEALDGGAPVTLEAVREAAPQLAQQIEADYAAVCLPCMDDLMAPENIRPFQEAYNDGFNTEPPPERLRVECELLRCLLEEYEPSKHKIEKGCTAYQWLARYYRWDILQACETYGASPDQPYYDEHPVCRQFLIAMLRRPNMRILTLVPLEGTLYDQESWVDACNFFDAFLTSGQPSPQLTVEPASADYTVLCTETAVWTMRQSEDRTTHLEIALENGEQVTITYTP